MTSVEGIDQMVAGEWQDMEISGPSRRNSLFKSSSRFATSLDLSTHSTSESKDP
jgi:hypothetical protein